MPADWARFFAAPTDTVDSHSVSYAVDAVVQLSPTAIVIWLLEQVGIDFAGAVVKPLMGDWTQVLRAGTAMAQMGDYLRYERDTMYASVSTLQDSWHGNAADAAAAQLAPVPQKLDAVATNLSEGAQQVSAAADMVESFARKLRDLVNEVLTKIGDALLSVWFPPLAIWRGIQAAKLFYKVISMINEFYQTLERAVPAIRFLQAMSHGSTSLKLEIGRGYDNPMVAPPKEGW